MTCTRAVLAVIALAAVGANLNDSIKDMDEWIDHKLSASIPLKFKDAPLGDILKHITRATKGPNDGGIPIDVDPKGLQAASVSLTTPITVETERGEPLAEALTYMLGANALRYQVEGGRLRISVAPLRAMLIDRRKQNKAVQARLAKTIDLKFTKTPLDEVLRFIKNASASPEDKGLPIYVDPVGLQEAEVTLTSPVSIEAEGIPIKTALRDLLKPLGLCYIVKDGLVTITTIESQDAPIDDGAKKRPESEPR